MTRKKKKKRTGSRKKGGWRSRTLTLVSFLLFFAVLSLLISTTLRWIVPPPGDPIFGRDVIRVEILNGCGKSGVAERVTDWLRENGFDIVYFGNADSFEYEKSILLDRSGRPEFTREVASVLGCANIEKRYDGLLLLDVTVIVGHDWEDLKLEATHEGTWETNARRFREMLEEWLQD